MMYFFIFLIIIYFAWCRLEKYTKIDYGNKHVNCLMGLNQLVCRKWHRLGDYWLDIPEEGGVILAANHQSGMDPPVLAAACRRPVRFLAIDYYYNLPVVNGLCKAVGAIPVYRNKDNKIALQKAVEALQNGEVIGIFPFGGIHAPNRPEPRIRSGTAVLSKLSGVPIIPVHIGGVNKFSFNRVFTSMFFKRSTLELTQHKAIQCDNQDNDIQHVLDVLYSALSNHNANKTKISEVSLDSTQC